MKLDFKNTTIAILLICLFLSISKCSHNENKAFKTTEAMLDTTKYFKNKLGTETASKIVLETDLKTFKQLVLKKDDSLKKLIDEFSRVKSVVKYKTIVSIDSIPVFFTDSIPCDFQRIGRFETKNIEFDWKIDQKRFDLSEIRIPNETKLITGFKRKWIFGRQTMTTDITNSNEYFKTSNVQTIEIKIPKRFDETRLFNIGVGIGAGFLMFK